MSLPPGFVEELRARVPVSEIVGRRVIWDARKSNPARGDFWACCPFHEEKSPSFHVDDRRGFYHCFGCHAKGDAITFLRERDNLGFMEAVEILARAAGMAMPAADPAAAERAKQRRGLAHWTEAAAAYFRGQLAMPQGAAARAYLSRRGLRPETQALFGVGYAPAARRALADALIAQGADEQVLLDAGLVGRPEGGGAVYDRFRDRVVFPIRDAQGVCIGFGARGLTADAKPKYLNSPETALFDKSRTLFNYGPAREAAVKAKTLIAVEGYMDVAALVEAGFAHAVAPMGTAVTEAHLTAMWRVADEPVMALDGDRAGLAAAMRVIDVALPLLQPGKSLRFALLPAGRDPDDVIRAEGPDAMRRLLDAAEPLAALLWRRETEGRAFDSPERRAALDARLRDVLASIAEPTVRGHYRAMLAERRAALFRPAAPQRAAGSASRFLPSRSRGIQIASTSEPVPSTRASALARAADPAAQVRAREVAIVLALLAHPSLALTCGDEVAAAEFEHADLDAIRSALISVTAMHEGVPDPAALFDAVVKMLGCDPRPRLETETSAVDSADTDVPARGMALKEPEMAEVSIREALARHAAERSRRREAAEAEIAIMGDAGAEVDGRLARAAAVVHRDASGTIRATDNLDAEASSFVRAAVADEMWVKRNRKRPDSNR